LNQYNFKLYAEDGGKREGEDKNSLNKDKIKGISNVNTALQDFYEEAINDVLNHTRVKEKQIRNWFQEKLITSSGTRSIVHRDRDSTGGLSNKAVDILENKYLIRREWRSGAQWYELTHDRLIKPIRYSNDKWYEQKTKLKRSILRKQIIIPVIAVIIFGFSIFIYNIYNAYNVLDQSLLKQKQIENLLSKGFNLYRLGNYTGSIQSYDKVLAIDPINKNALLNKGIALDDLGNYSEAMNYYNKVLSIDPTNTEALKNKGVALDKLGNRRGSMENYDKALAINSTNIATLYDKGLTLQELKNYSGVMNYYDKALAIDPTYTDAIINKGISLYDLGNYSEAMNYYNKALAIDPTNIDALQDKIKILTIMDNYT
jgi:Flp pilus assembly protein TadD